MDLQQLSSKFSVRSLTEDDLDRIFHLCCENSTFYQYHPPMVTYESIRQDMTDLPPGKPPEDKYYVGFFQGDTLIAVMDFVLGYPNASTVFVGFFMMNTAVQGRGLGTELITGFAGCMSQLGFETLRLAIDRGNPQSERFWTKNQFRKTGEEVPNDFSAYLLMERPLMHIRHAVPADLPRILDLYAHARTFMADTGNPRQWGNTNWPPEHLVREDIHLGRSYVCVHQGEVVAVFVFVQGRRIEPTYDDIQGSWRGSDTYGVVHRIATDHSRKGIGAFCLNWALDQCGSLRIDTHGDNTVMQHLLSRLGFRRSGIIHVREDNDPRLAYEKQVPVAL